MDNREWRKLPAHEQTWTERKNFCVAYAAKQHGEKERDGVDQPFGGVVESIPTEDSLPAGLNEMMDSLAVYLENIVAEATENDSAQGGLLAELSASIDILEDTNYTQAKELEQLQQEVNALQNRKGIGDAMGNLSNQEVCPNCAAVGRSAPHKKGNFFFDKKKMTNIKEWARKLVDDKSVKCRDNE